jgi:hypothetical protein
MDPDQPTVLFHVPPGFQAVRIPVASHWLLALRQLQPMNLEINRFGEERVIWNSGLNRIPEVLRESAGIFVLPRALARQANATPADALNRYSR